MKARRWRFGLARGKRAVFRLALGLLLALVALRGLGPAVALAGASASPAVGKPALTATPTAGGQPAIGGQPTAGDESAADDKPLADGRPVTDGKPALTGRPAAVGTPSRPLAESSEALASRSIWSQPQSYPLAQQPRADLYRPSAAWLGRLILPTPAQVAAPSAPAEDWVWIEIEQAPAERHALIGQRLRLRWADRPELRRLVQTVTTTIQLGEAARQAAAAANVVPTRLDGRRVGPLQTLAGARPRDDVTVALEAVSVVEAGAAASPTAEAKAAAKTAATTDATGVELRIASPPVQITGRWQGLVRVVGRGAGEDLWRVRHYTPSGGGFDGVEETIRISALPPDRFGYRLLDPTGLVVSPSNAKGWLIQGAPAADGVFTVQALLPYALLELSPDRVVTGSDPALAYGRHDSWRHPLRRGSLSRTALIPDRKPPPPWAVGERALLMHLFGGIGGKDAEVVQGWTVTGHFAFGEAEVVRDALSGRPRLAIRYHQIYATNPNGIIAGTQDWSAYAGSLQRGWIGLRPFSDLLIPMGAPVLDAIALQAELMAARYRSGDGSGVALVTPSTSCVQDSAQALWIAIQQLRLQRRQPENVATGPAGSAAMSALDQQRLHDLGLAFDHLLEPFGRVRGDWRRNAESALAAGTGSGRGIASSPAKSLPTTTHIGPTHVDPFQASQSLKDALLSWRSLLPRSAHDLFAAEFLRVGLPLLALRTNQIPGADPRLEPLAPTALFGQLPGVSLLLGRLGDGLFPLWQPGGHLAALAVAAVYGVIALALGRLSGWLPRRWHWSPVQRLLPRAVRLFLVPAFAEELVFRGLLLPSLLDGVTPWAMLPWMALSVGLFVLWHGLKHRFASGRWWLDRQEPRPLAKPAQRCQPPLQITLLGSACSLVYVVSGSLWPAVLLHGLAVVAWREGLGGGKPRRAVG